MNSNVTVLSMMMRKRQVQLIPPLKSFATTFLNFLYPPVCLLCETPLQRSKQMICQMCLEGTKKIERPYCGRCGSPQKYQANRCVWCLKVVSGIKLFRSAHSFEGAVEEIVHNFKYQGWTGLKSLMAEAMSDMLGECEDLHADVFVPVPLHSVRKRERGYNQSELLCDEISKSTGIGRSNSLKRVRNTPSQTGLNLDDRRKNVDGAFDLVDRFPIKDMRVLVVDDVLTTGSTISSCAQALIRCGAKEVSVLTYARAGVGE